MEKIAAYDLFESSYYLMNHCEIDSIEFFRMNGKTEYQLTIKGPLIPELRKQYSNGLAEVNLMDFKSVYSNLNLTITQAEEEFRSIVQNESGNYQ